MRRYIFNSSWMLAEQLLRIVSGVFVGIYIARYLGPESFGILSYVLAIAAFAIAISRLGMEAVLVRELVTKHEAQSIIMGTAFWLMVAAGAASYIIILVTIKLTDETKPISTYALMVATSAAFTSFLAIDYKFQANLKAKLSTICKVTTLAIMSSVKIVLVVFEMKLIWFVVASIIDHGLLALLLTSTMWRKQGLGFMTKFEKTTAITMLRSAWPMVITAVAGMILMRTDQVMIRNMLGLSQVGIYSAAVRIYESWIMLPYILSVSLLPAIIKLRQGEEDNYKKGLTKLFSLTIWVSIIAAIFITLTGEKIISLTFGESYIESGPILTILMWAAVFSSINSLSARYFSVEHMERKILSRMLIAATLNVFLNYLLIPKFGIKGSAYATLISMFISSYALDWFDKDLKKLLKIKNRAIIPKIN